MRIVRYTYPSARSLVTPGRFPTRSPWTGLESEIDRLFNSVLSDVVGSRWENSFPIDLFEDKDNTYVRAELPGVNRDDIQVEVVDGYLTVSAQRKVTEGEQTESYSASRSIQVPDHVQADRIAAAYENGVLTVTLPKKEEAKPQKITVAVK